jgi:hypothetical protein
MDLNAPGRKPLRHDSGSALLFETDLRVRMKVAPNRDELILVGSDAVNRTHPALPW